MARSSSRSRLFAAAFVVLWLAALPALAQQAPEAQTFAQGAIGGKADRTPAEQKLDSTLLFAVRAFAPTRGQIPTPLQPGVQSFIDQNVAADQTIFVVIKADVSPDLVAMLRVTGAYDISEFPQYDTITARVPITALLAIAQRTDVRTIGPREQRRLNRYFPPEEPEPTDADGRVINAGSVNWQGVTAHKANLVQSTGIDGTGVKICVLSDGVNSLAARQASGDLPAVVTVLAGQAGSGDEGTAMLEIIHDIAPGAALGFATADPSQAQFATNIQNLRTVAGCNIIVDDVTYFAEGAFQDGIISQAVNAVTAAGVLYFSSAANSGNKIGGTSGTFEGDFVASAAAIPALITAFETPLPAGGISLHSFGANNFTTLQSSPFVVSAISLKWSDPLGGSGNDYDLIVMNSTSTAILCNAGGNSQTGTQDPVEFAFCNPGSFPSGSRIYIVKYGSASATRALRLDTNRGTITAANATNGSTFGHNAAASGFSVASIGYPSLSGSVFTGGTSVHVDFYSSDGPRKMFFTPAGAAITPGNVLFGTGGGTTLPKVDLTASDCGSTSTPGFTTFCGTSAAAPSAAAIAGLIKSANSAATKAQITTALLNSALDIETVGTDVNSGVGTVMADAAVRNILSPVTIAKSFVPPSIASGGTSVLTIQVTNPNTTKLQGVVFTDTYPSPQVKNAAVPSAAVTGPAGCAGTLAAVAAGGTFGVTAATLPAGSTCTFTVIVTSSTVGGPYADSTGNLTTPIALNNTGATAALTVTGGAGTTPVLQSIVARKVHGAAGTFDLPLTFLTPPTINHNPTTEPRQGPTHQLVFTYDKPLNAATATVTEGAASSSSSVVGSTVVVNLTGVTNQQYVTVSLTNVGSTDGGTGGVGEARVGFLAGDINQNRVVSVGDVGLVNAQLAQVVTAANYLRDVNATGTLTVADKSIANSNLAKALLAP